MSKKIVLAFLCVFFEALAFVAVAAPRERLLNKSIPTDIEDLIFGYLSSNDQLSLRAVSRAGRDVVAQFGPSQRKVLDVARLKKTAGPTIALDQNLFWYQHRSHQASESFETQADTLARLYPRVEVLRLSNRPVDQNAKYEILAHSQISQQNLDDEELFIRLLSRLEHLTTIDLSHAKTPGILRNIGELAQLDFNGTDKRWMPSRLLIHSFRVNFGDHHSFEDLEKPIESIVKRFPNLTFLSLRGIFLENWLHRAYLFAHIYELRSLTKLELGFGFLDGTYVNWNLRMVLEMPTLQEFSVYGVPGKLSDIQDFMLELVQVLPSTSLKKIRFVGFGDTNQDLFEPLIQAVEALRMDGRDITLEINQFGD